jgi:peptide/nickel transport system substrate-binding protein
MPGTGKPKARRGICRACFGWEAAMRRKLRLCAAVGAGLVMLVVSHAAAAQKPGGILKSYSIDSPASMSIHEEATVFAVRPMMAVMNNLVMYDQNVKQNSMQSIVPDLATSWSWDEETGRKLSFKLRQGIKWHDGKPFTAADVKCTWDLLLGRSNDKLRLNPRKGWYRNLEEVTTNGDYEVTFVLQRPHRKDGRLLVDRHACRAVDRIRFEDAALLLGGCCMRHDEHD